MYCMKVLSIIVPAYNSQQFLDTGIPSFLHEEILDQLDVIIVDDGSTDETASAAQKYCDQYPGTVRLIRQENKGHGGALNTGCAAAVGKYLKVVDADDWVETQNLPEFIHWLENNESDVILTHHYTRDISTGEVKKWKNYPPAFGKGYSFEEIMTMWKSFDRSLTFHGITYNTAFYHQHGYRLSEHVFYEDHEFATFPCCYAKTVTPLDLFIYDYRVGDVQQSVSNANQLKRLGHTETVLRRMAEEFHKLDLPESCGGRAYVCMKTQGLLLSYLTTTLLVNPDRKAGRNQAAAMMDYFKQNVPEIYGLAKKQYAVFYGMNLLHMNKKHWETILNSKLYNRFWHKHSFE